MNYVKILAVSVDIFLASIFWNKPDVTISSLCGLALRKDPNVRSFEGYLGRMLNRIQKDHCEHAIASDIIRAQGILKVLS